MRVLLGRKIKLQQHTLVDVRFQFWLTVFECLSCAYKTGLDPEFFWFPQIPGYDSSNEGFQVSPILLTWKHWEPETPLSLKPCNLKLDNLRQTSEKFLPWLMYQCSSCLLLCGPLKGMNDYFSALNRPRIPQINPSEWNFLSTMTVLDLILFYWGF